MDNFSDTLVFMDIFGYNYGYELRSTRPIHQPRDTLSHL